MNFEVEVVNENEVLLKLDTSRKEIVERAKIGVQKAVINLVGYIKENLLSGQVLKNRTGNLRRAIHYSFEDNGLSARVYIGEEAWYGGLHELGVLHSWVIEARNAKALAFKIGGETVFAKKVTHPGLEERSFMRRGLSEQREQIIETITDEVNNA